MGIELCAARRVFNSLWHGVCFGLLGLCSCQLVAAEDKPALKNTVAVSGFFSAVATQTVNDKASVYKDKIASDEVTLANRENRIGVQFQSDIADDMSFTALLVAHGGDFNYSPSFDWGYIDYKVSKSFNLHIGKYKIPQFLVSDYADVGYAYPWVRPPQDVYATNPLVALSGVNAFYNIPFYRNNLLFQFFAGGGPHEVYVPARSLEILGLPNSLKGIRQNVNIKDTRGVNMVFTRGNFSLRAGRFRTVVDAPDLNIHDAGGAFSGYGSSFQLGWFVFYAEYINRRIDDVQAVAFPDQKAWYTTLGARLGNTLTYATRSNIDEGEKSSNKALRQNSLAFGLRFELNASTALKMEALYARPVYDNHGLFNDVVERGEVYSVSLDSIF